MFLFNVVGKGLLKLKTATAQPNELRHGNGSSAQFGWLPYRDSGPLQFFLGVRNTSKVKSEKTIP